MRIDRIKLVTEMAKRNLTQKKLSEISGVSRVSVSNIKSGKSCSEETANKIAAALGISIENLVER